MRFCIQIRQWLKVPGLAEASQLHIKENGLAVFFSSHVGCIIKRLRIDTGWAFISPSLHLLLFLQLLQNQSCTNKHFANPESALNCWPCWENFSLPPSDRSAVAADTRPRTKDYRGTLEYWDNSVSTVSPGRLCQTGDVYHYIGKRLHDDDVFTILARDQSSKGRRKNKKTFVEAD